ncbi:MAG: diacylglycerol kinase family protein [Thermoanaerobaculia bacterium]
MANASRLLLNPAAGRGRGARAASVLGELASRHGLDLVVTASLDHLLAEVREAVARGDERLPLAGGDGTFHHAVQALAGTETALAPLPVGSGNDLTACLGVPGDLAAALETLLEAPVVPFDLGQALGRSFALFAGLGIDGEVAHYNNTRVRRLGGTAAYVYSLLRVLPGFRVPELAVTWDRGSFEGPAYLALAANCPRVGGGMRLTPEASWNDGLLDLILVDAVPKSALLRIFPRVFRAPTPTTPPSTSSAPAPPASAPPAPLAQRRRRPSRGPVTDSTSPSARALRASAPADSSACAPASSRAKANASTRSRALPTRPSGCPRRRRPRGGRP